QRQALSVASAGKIRRSSGPKKAVLLFCLMLAACGGGSGGNGGSGASAAPPPLTPSQWMQNQARAIEHTDAPNDDYADLQPLGDAIGNARIVALAEADHGSGTIMSMKSRLIKYLHEKKGFDVVNIESSEFTMHRIWQLAQQGQAGQTVDSLAPHSIFFPTAMSAEGRAILQY